MAKVSPHPSENLLENLSDELERKGEERNGSSTAVIGVAAMSFL